MLRILGNVKNEVHFYVTASSNSQNDIKLKLHDAKLPSINLPKQTF